MHQEIEMNKKCAIYREILFSARTKKQIRFTQKELAFSLGISTSTVFHALQTARAASITRVTGRFFVLQDYRKLLYLFATERNLKKDVIYSGHLDKASFDIEAVMPPGITFGLYSAARFLLPSMPVEYDHIYIYSTSEEVDVTLARIGEKEIKKNSPHNFFIIKKDKFFDRYPQPIPEQIFVDMWNAPEWYAKDILASLEQLLPL